MTKYILHGGDTFKNNNDNNNFFREMVLGLEGKIKILLNYFSREESEYEKLVKQDRQRLLRYSKNKDLEFQVAETERFEKQLRWADVMYMRGGSTERLMKKLRKVKNIERLFEGKVIAGSSAGAYALSRYYYDNNSKILRKGLRVLNIKCYCHCKPEDIKIIRKLIVSKEEIPLILLPNYKMFVI